MLKKMRKHKYKYKLILMNEKNSLLSYDIYLKKKRKKTFIFLFFLLISIILFCVFVYNSFIKKIEKYENDIEKYNKTTLRYNRTLNEEFNDMQKFVNMAVNHSLINPNEKFYKSKYPKISVVIPMYNAEGYIENAVCAIENQDLKDIEIIIIDDCSKDNSVKVVKQLIKRDPRIILYQNKETKGTLYSKCKGVSLSSSKYVLVSDHDDLYTQADAFSSMYYEMEKNNLDILGFASIFTPSIKLRQRPALYIFQNIPKYYQPFISNRMYRFKNNNTIVQRVGDVIWNYIFRTSIFMKSIQQIDDKIMNTRMNCHEDFLLFFLLTRNANSIKNIRRIFYAHIYWVNATKASIIFSKEEKKIVKANYKCLSYINYIEFLLGRTNNSVEDKRIASYELQNWFLNNNCKNNTFIQERAINVCKSFLENQYIEKEVKDKIQLFLKQTKEKII
jgi:glycosyltransferase involved in cell wall biosynthesis